MSRQWMQTTLWAAGCAVLATSVQLAGAQQTSQAPADPYQGVAHPPSATILTNESAGDAAADAVVTKPAKPSPAVVAPAVVAAPSVAPAAASATPTSTDPSANFPAANADPDGDIVHPAVNAAKESAESAAPVLSARPAAANDPDGDIVHPMAAQPGQLAEGTMFQVQLLDRLSSDENARGDRFHAKVISDVLQGGKVLIPAGSTMEGRISSVSSGHFAGHGSMRLSPDTLILPDSSRLSLHAEVSGVPGTNARINDEGSIDPGSRRKRASVEYGAVTAAGAATGAVFAGPVGALTGGLIGAGMVTTHLAVSHPQTTLESGTTILFTLTSPLNLIPATNSAQNQAANAR